MKRQPILLARTIVIGILLLFIVPQLFAELLNDGSFENQPSDWEEYYNTACNAVSIGDWTSALGEPPPDGQQSFWAGGACGSVVANNGARQEITFQPDAALLSFWYLPFKEFADPQSNDIAVVAFDDTTIWELNVDGITSPTGWNNAILDITQFSDQTGTLSIEMQQNSDQFVAPYLF
ncbi:hypothetical protein MNBD_CHLOROFLEXI01-3068 [hydrothermal vent metagenome]|uniref:Uncharacterized protein n=1 Tax=hydrothermal vent metagenome TaxID=652676 RepID=A0A3B0VZI2_9ZZZZ